MLEAVRENLKGTLMIVVVVIFIVPMVISGVGTTFLGSVAGNDAATVNNETVTSLELDRAVSMRRQQILSQQGANISPDQLTDEMLRGPILEQLTRRLAIVTHGEKAGMGLSDKQFSDAVKRQEAFFTDGKFNQQKYNSLLGQAGLTSATFRRETARDLILSQQAIGLQLSAFATPAQLEQVVKLTHQKRSFYAVDIPASLADENIQVSEKDLQAYYDAHTSEFQVPEKVKVDYLELSVSGIAESIEVSEAEILQQYEAETANFSADANYEVAHILLEDTEQQEIDELASKIGAGESFEQLAKTYSDDLASSEDGGNLGILTPGSFPEAFENAVYTLEEGQVSGPVDTDAGTHFIKVTKKITTEVPSYESRKDAIAAEIARVRAADEFASLVETLGDLTFFAEDLTGAASQMGLEIKQSTYFDRNTGSGIAENAAVREAAFDESVLSLGKNSNRINVSPEQVVFLRLAGRKPAYVKSLEEVLPLVEARVQKQKAESYLASLSSEFIASVKSGADAEAIASEKNYGFAKHELAQRTDFSIDPSALSLAFEADAPSDGYSFVSELTRDGGYRIVAVSAVEDGKIEDLEDADKARFEAQIVQEISSFSGASYEDAIVETADIDIH